MTIPRWSRTSKFALLLVVLLAGGMLVAASPAYGQSRLQTQRAYVASPQVLGMGNAGVAAPRAQSVFFYNPAHLARTGRRIMLLGVQGQFSTGVIDQAQFFADRLEPALDRGLETLSSEELQALYDDAIDRGHRPTTIDGALLLPSIVWQMGPVGAGLGVFSYTDLTYRFGHAGLGVPRLELVGRTDAMARGAVSVELDAMGVPGLAVGLMGTLTRRYFTFENAPLDAIDAGENVLVLEGTALGLDVGLLYDVPVDLGPGTLSLGAAMYDLQTTGFDYAFYGTLEDWPPFGNVIGLDGGAPSAAQIERDVRRANERFDVSMSYRVGATYRLQGVSALPGAAVTVDYVGEEEPSVDRTFLAHLHLGGEVQPLPGVALRVGLSQGYPTAGIGLGLGAVRVDYAFHGVEHGRYPGQIPSFQHTVQLTVALF